MYKVKGSLWADDLKIIEDRAEISILDRMGFLPIVANGGNINIDVPNENSKLQIDVFGYSSKIVTAKDINAKGGVYLNNAILISTNVKAKTSNNTLLYVLGAVGVLGILHFVTKKPKIRTVKIS